MTEPAHWAPRGNELAARSIADGEPTRWFDEIYAAGASGEVTMPWDRTAPSGELAEWAKGLDGRGMRAVVVGCGLGADAEYVASLGFATLGFDVSETAIRVARERSAGSVTYEVGDLLRLPEAWLRAFDLVVEVITAQALPDPPRATAIVNIGRLVAPGGTLVAVEYADDGAGDRTGPPFRLSRAEVEAFATDGLDLVRVELLDGPRWRVECHRPS